MTPAESGPKPTNGHEKALVDGLFFLHRTETSERFSSITDKVSIRSQSSRRNCKARRGVPPSGEMRVGWLISARFLAGASLLARAASQDPRWWGGVIAAVFAKAILNLLLQIPDGSSSRESIGLTAAALFMIPALLLLPHGSVPQVPGTGQLSSDAIGAITWSLHRTSSTAWRHAAKRLHSETSGGGTGFFLKERESLSLLRTTGIHGCLRSLGKQVDVWSSHHATTSTDSSTWDRAQVRRAYPHRPPHALQQAAAIRGAGASGVWTRRGGNGGRSRSAGPGGSDSGGGSSEFEQQRIFRGGGGDGEGGHISFVLILIDAGVCRRHVWNLTEFGPELKTFVIGREDRYSAGAEHPLVLKAIDAVRAAVKGLMELPISRTSSLNHCGRLIQYRPGGIANPLKPAEVAAAGQRGPSDTGERGPVDSIGRVLDFAAQPASLIWRGVYHDHEGNSAKLGEKFPEDAKKLLSEYPGRKK
jgi:hypothetical protein